MTVNWKEMDEKVDAWKEEAGRLYEGLVAALERRDRTQRVIDESILEALNSLKKSGCPRAFLMLAWAADKDIRSEVQLRREAARRIAVGFYLNEGLADARSGQAVEHTGEWWKAADAEAGLTGEPVVGEKAAKAYAAALGRRGLMARR